MQVNQSLLDFNILLEKYIEEEKKLSLKGDVFQKSQLDKNVKKIFGRIQRRLVKDSSSIELNISESKSSNTILIKRLLRLDNNIRQLSVNADLIRKNKIVSNILGKVQSLAIGEAKAEADLKKKRKREFAKDFSSHLQNIKKHGFDLENIYRITCFISNNLPWFRKQANDLSLEEIYKNSEGLLFLKKKLEDFKMPAAPQNLTESHGKLTRLLNKIQPGEFISFPKLPSDIRLHIFSYTFPDLKSKEDGKTFCSLIKEQRFGSESNKMMDLANWMNINEIPLGRLALTREEILLLIPHLTYLYIGSDEDLGFNTAEIFGLLSKARKLKTLILKNLPITHLPPLPKLERLSCFFLSDFKKLPVFPKLKYLLLRGCYGITKVRSFPELKTLIWKNDYLGNPPHVFLDPQPNLEELHVYHLNFSQQLLSLPKLNQIVGNNNNTIKISVPSKFPTQQFSGLIMFE